MIESMLIPLTIFCLVVVPSVVHCGTGNWQYGQGVREWKDDCHSGQNQSPIRIQPSTTLPKQLPGFGFVNYNVDGQTLYMSNTGHTVKFTVKTTKPITVVGGGLPSNYEFAQGHFHWGNSEHEIAGDNYKMELHLVHYNLDRGKTFSAAAGSGASDSLAVLGIMFKIGRRNDKLDEFFEAVKKVKAEGDRGAMKSSPSLKLSNFLPDNVDMFYRYNGSLTTPACNEIVVWTVFKNHIEISQDQYNAINMLQSSNGKLIENNYRPVQDVGSRQVWNVDARQFKTYEHICAGSSSHSAVTGTMIILLAILKSFI